MVQGPPLQLRLLLAALVAGIGAPGVERAARGRINEVGRRAGNRDQLLRPGVRVGTALIRPIV